MKEEILDNQNDPGALEKLYRSAKASFKQEFTILYPELKGNPLADFWNERLHYQREEISKGTGKQLLMVILASMVAGVFAKIPDIFQIEEAFFYSRNIGFIFLPLLVTYFAWKNALAFKKLFIIGGILMASLIYINILPSSTESDMLVLICIHLPIMLWFLLGWSYVGNKLGDHSRRLGFLKYNGDLVVISALVLISGGIMTGITLGLFSLIGFNIEEFYFNNIVVFGLPAVPIVGTYLTINNPELVGKVSPVIARIFSPLVLVMLVIYLIAMVYAKKDPFHDREFLLIFNALLIGVMAIIFFSVAETSKPTKTKLEILILFLLAIVTIIVNGIALSAILFRISEWGFTPNRTAVLGGNILILINLLQVTTKLFKAIVSGKEMIEVGKTISRFLPVYFFWSLIVCFLFPFIFGFG